MNKNRKSAIIIPVRSLKKPDSRAHLRGPGYYKIKNFLEAPKPYRNSSAFIIGDTRWRNPKEIFPGPGDYNNTTSL